MTKKQPTPTKPTPPPAPTNTELQKRAKALGLYSVVNNWESYQDISWLPALLDQEELERYTRSLARRRKRAKLQQFKPMADFDWSWPGAINRPQIEELFTLRFLSDATNVLLIGDHGVGKTMIAKNLAHEAVLQGKTALFMVAHAVLNDLADYTTGSALIRRLKHYARFDVLVLDELGYLNQTAAYGDLFFQLINERYQKKSTIITSNKPVSQWQDIFSSAAGAQAVMDRLLHHAEIVTIEAASYRTHEARLREEARQKRTQDKKTKERKTA